MSRGLNFILPPLALILRRRGETTGDRRSGDRTRFSAPVVPPLRHLIISLTFISRFCVAAVGFIPRGLAYPMNSIVRMKKSPQPLNGQRGASASSRRTSWPNRRGWLKMCIRDRYSTFVLKSSVARPFQPSYETLMVCRLALC